MLQIVFISAEEMKFCESFVQNNYRLIVLSYDFKDLYLIGVSHYWKLKHQNNVIEFENPERKATDFFPSKDKSTDLSVKNYTFAFGYPLGLEKPPKNFTAQLLFVRVNP